MNHLPFSVSFKFAFACEPLQLVLDSPSMLALLFVATFLV